MSTPPDPREGTLPAEAARLIAALQSELAGMKAEIGGSLEETLANLAQENMLLKRRLYGNKTERSRTSEAQLALGDLLAAEARLQKELDEAVAQAAKEAGVGPNGPSSPGPSGTAHPASTIYPASGQPHTCTRCQGCSPDYPTEYCAFNGPHGWQPVDPGQATGWDPPEARKFITRF